MVENHASKEVWIRVCRNTQPSKVEVIGLLGGWKSKAEYELYDKGSNPDKVASRAFAENRNVDTNNASGTCASDRREI